MGAQTSQVERMKETVKEDFSTWFTERYHFDYRDDELTACVVDDVVETFGYVYPSDCISLLKRLAQDLETMK